MTNFKAMDINCVIIDDEPNNVSNLQAILRDHADKISVVGVANNALDGIEVIQRTKPNLIFLDIQMPDKLGFEVLKDFPNPDF